MDATKMDEFAEVFPHLAVSDADMEKNIGRKVRYLNGGHEPSDGTTHAMLFEVIGVQHNYREELCYRVKCLDYDDRFGRVMSLDRVVWVDNG